MRNLFRQVTGAQSPQMSGLKKWLDGAAERSCEAPFSMAPSRVIALFQEALQADASTVWIADPVRQSFHSVASSLSSADQSRLRLHSESTNGRAAHVARSRLPQYYEDLESNPAACNIEGLRALGLKSMWVTPLLVAPHVVEHRVSAVVISSFRSCQPGEPATSMELVTVLAHLASQALEHAIFSEHDAIVRDVFNYSTSLEFRPWVSLDGIAKSISDLLGFEACSLLLADQDSQTLTIVGTTGLDTREPRRQWKYEFGFGGTGRAASQRVPIYSETCENETWHAPPRFPETVKTHQMTQFLAVPILSGTKHGEDKLVGVLRLRNKLSIPQLGTSSRALTHLDVVRAHRASTVIAPLLLLLAAKMRRDGLLRRVRHELHLPATLIQNAANFFRHLSTENLAKRLPDIRKKMIEFEELAQIQMLNADMLQVITEERIRLECRRINLVHTVREACKLMVHHARAKGLDLQFLVPTDVERLPLIYADARVIKMILYNLISNAVKYSHENTTIRVELFPARGVQQHHRVRVHNHGVGVPAEDAERIFERYYRSPSAYVISASGAGLGLTIARQLAKQHEGALDLVNLNEPTTFELLLPITLESCPPKEEKEDDKEGSDRR
jgi:signal transduction histidine kinase